MNTLPITLRFNYEKKDFDQACKQMPSIRRSQMRGAFLAILSTAYGLFLLFYFNEKWIAYYLILVGLILFSLRFFIPKIISSRLWKLPKNRTETFLEFSDEGIIYKTQDIDSNLKWSLYDGYIETSHAFLLLHTRNLFTVIPKRVLEQPEQLNQFRALVEKQISRKKRK